MCLGCKIYGSEAIAYMHVSGSIYNSARDFSVSPGPMLRTCTKVKLLGRLCITGLKCADYFTNVAFVPIYKRPNQDNRIPTLVYLNQRSGKIVMIHSSAVILYICLLYKLGAFAIC